MESSSGRGRLAQSMRQRACCRHPLDRTRQSERSAIVHAHALVIARADQSCERPGFMPSAGPSCRLRVRVAAWSSGPVWHHVASSRARPGRAPQASSGRPPAALPADGASQQTATHDQQHAQQRQQHAAHDAAVVTDLRSGLGHSMSYDNRSGGGLPAAASQGLWQRLRTGARTATARLLYRYYCWRRDTFSDLQLLLALSALLFLAGAWVEGAVMRGLDTALDAAMSDATAEAPGWWVPLYAVSRVAEVAAQHC